MRCADKVLRVDLVAPDLAFGDFQSTLVPYNPSLMERRLGKGSFGLVFEGVYRKQKVAVKKLLEESNQAAFQRKLIEFQKEARLMR